MDDAQIVTLYWARREEAIEESVRRYDGLCRHVIGTVLTDEQDAQECLNDVWNAAWNAMPPHRPEKLAPFLAKLARRAALHRLRTQTAQKRGGGEASLALEELAECLPCDGDTQHTVEQQELIRAVNVFLAELGKQERRVFLCRYWYFDSVADIARRFHWSESRVKMTCKRARQKLVAYLQKEEWL